MPFQFLGATTLVWQPDTRVQTFDSGLVLVQRSAICRNTYIATARSSYIGVGRVLPCSSPSTVTVFQFPRAQEIHEGNGYVRFDVSGYGYFGTGFTRDEKFLFNVVNGLGGTEQLIVDRVQRVFVAGSTVTINPWDYTPSAAITVRNRAGTTFAVSGAYWALENSDVSGYFGSYKEISLSFAPSFTVA
jgi:hypothetical protein